MTSLGLLDKNPVNCELSTKARQCRRHLESGDPPETVPHGKEALLDPPEIFSPGHPRQEVPAKADISGHLAMVTAWETLPAKLARA
jgi:hypothetical protein